DVLIDGGVIGEIGTRLDGDTVIDAGGLVLLPGLVDLHTHLREPGREDTETIGTGSAAAALGGFTAVHAMANTDPVADTAEIVEHAQDPRLADSAACAHEGPLSGRLGLPGWPGVAEESIVARDVMLAEHTGSRLHICHVSTAGTVEVLRWAKARGIPVTAEVTPHHLLLTCDLLEDYDPVYKVNPPLRPAEDVEALRAALAEGVIDAVATDHAPHAAHDKDHAFGDAALGMLGLQTALGVVAQAMVAT